jgi:hypothetical protein
LNYDIQKLYIKLNELISNNTNLFEENLLLKRDNVNCNITINNLKIEINSCNEASE